MDFLSPNSRFAVQNDGTYLPQITRETCIRKARVNRYLDSYALIYSGILFSKDNEKHENNLVKIEK